jgi:hypothetical protein
VATHNTTLQARLRAVLGPEACRSVEPPSGECPWRDGRSVQQGMAGPIPWLKAASGVGRQQKSPRQRQGLKEVLGQTIKRSSGTGGLDAAAQLAAEPESRSGAQDRQGTRDVTEVVVDPGHKRLNSGIVRIGS